MGSRSRPPWAQVRVACALEQMPRVAEALARGEISTAAADALARAREAGPEAFARAEEAFARAEEVFVESARSRSHHKLFELDRWRQTVDAERAARDEDERHARRRLTAVVAADGMVRTEGELDPENGQYLITALRAKVDAWARQGPSTSGSRRSVEPMRSARSAVSGSTWPSAPPSAASARTSS